MKATDYILINDNNKTFPFGIEIYITIGNKVVGINYEGFTTISKAIKFVQQTNVALVKQK